LNISELTYVISAFKFKALDTSTILAYSLRSIIEPNSTQPSLVYAHSD